MEENKNIEIPFGAKDSELYGFEYTIPEGFEAEIKDGKVIVRKVESEDERIRKEIISALKFANVKGVYDKHIAWLEKKVEQKFKQKFFINDKVVHKATGKIWTIHHYLKNTNSYYVEDNDGLLHHYRESELKLVEQKPADKVEPKFKVGDWVVYDHRPYQIVELPKEGYINLGLRGDEKIEFAPSTYCRRWTIQDAKDGDVLYECNEKKPFIFKELETKHIGDIASYCDIFNGIFNPNEDSWTTLDIVPATKEQHDFLFQKMKEAGYEWDAKKKELKKVEQNNTDEYIEVKGLSGIEAEELTKEMSGEKHNLTDFERTLADICIGWIGEEPGWKEYIKDNADVLLKIAVKKFNSVQDSLFEQNPAWSEEDEKMLNACTEFIGSTICANYGEDDGVTKQSCRNWLKSLKDRVFPKQEWSEKDEYNAAFVIETLLGLDGYEEYMVTLKRMAKWLKSLKDRYTWKPDSAMIVSLQYAINHIYKEGDKNILSKLLEQLKKL